MSQDAIAQEVLPLDDTLTSVAETVISAPLDENVPIDDVGAATSEVRLPAVIERDNQSSDAEIVGDMSNSAPPTDVIETTVNKTAEPVELIFEFSGDCWMNLADATGENIAYGVKVKGRRMPVTGIPPFVVTLGAPEVVKIRYAGEALDMSFLPSGRIAKFDLPLSE